MIKITDTVKHLIIINVIMFVGTITLGNGQLFYEWFALYSPQGGFFKPWQILTHMFMHGGMTHLLFNMLGVWMFGSAVENSLGSKRFLMLYFASGLGAVALQLGVDYFQYHSIVDSIESLESISQMQIDELGAIAGKWMVGASGCLMGILVAFGILNPNAELMLIFLPIPIKAKYFIPLLVGYDIISGFLGGVSIFGANIAHWAHVGGALTGLIIMFFWKKNTFDKYRID